MDHYKDIRTSKNCRLFIDLTPHERTVLKRIASSKNMSVSEYIKYICITKPWKRTYGN